MSAFSLEKDIPIARGMPVLMGLGMVVIGALLVGFGIVRGNDLITSATDVLFCVSDHNNLRVIVLRRYSSPNLQLGESI